MRLDRWLVAHGHADTRSRARWLIESGEVWVGGQPCRKPSLEVSAASQLHIRCAGLRYVSRGGLKLEHALKTLQLEVRGLVAFDIGASTGGFTDCLLQHGAHRVYALDVGTGQLHPSLRDDARVIAFEGQNVRTFPPTSLKESVDLITVDVSFISLALILPLLPSFLCPGGIVLALIKPQFEVGAHDVGRGGIVRDASARARAVQRILEMAIASGFDVIQTIDTPRIQARRNQERFVCLAGVTTDRPPLQDLSRCRVSRSLPLTRTPALRENA